MRETQNVKTTFTVFSCLKGEHTQEAFSKPCKLERQGIEGKSVSAVCQPKVPRKSPALLLPLLKAIVNGKANKNWEEERQGNVMGGWEQELGDVAQGE